LAPRVNIALFEAELAAFAHQAGVGTEKQIVLVLDRAGWHSTQRLKVPDHVHSLFLPPYSPALQLAEHLWPLTNTVLVHRHFTSIEELEDAQAAAWVALQTCRDLVRSTTLFHWWPQRLTQRQRPGRT
jgi:transposase